MDQSERRVYPRVKLVTKVTHLRGDFFHYYYTRDLSAGGMFLETREPFPLGTGLMMEFPLPNVADRVTVEGRVVRVIHPDHVDIDMPSGMGIQFINLDEESHALIANFVSKLLH